MICWNEDSNDIVVINRFGWKGFHFWIFYRLILCNFESVECLFKIQAFILSSPGCLNTESLSIGASKCILLAVFGNYDILVNWLPDQPIYQPTDGHGVHRKVSLLLPRSNCFFPRTLRTDLWWFERSWCRAEDDESLPVKLEVCDA